MRRKEGERPRRGGALALAALQAAAERREETRTGERLRFCTPLPLLWISWFIAPGYVEVVVSKDRGFGWWTLLARSR